MERVNSPHRDEYRYRITTLVCMAVALIGSIGIVHYWPEFAVNVNTDGVFDTHGVPVELKMIDQTKQIAKPPPPPAPVPPVVVPDDMVLDFEELEVTAEIDIEGDANADAESSLAGPRLDLPDVPNRKHHLQRSSRIPATRDRNIITVTV